MAPLITREEARLLGELSDHAEIEALVERVHMWDPSTQLRYRAKGRRGAAR